MMRALVLLGCLAAAALGKSLSDVDEMTCTLPDGSVYKQGETWMADCNRCFCGLNGDSTAAIPACTMMACPKWVPCKLDDGTVVQPDESYTNGTGGACVCNHRNCNAGIQFVTCDGAGVQQPIQCEEESSEENEESNSISSESSDEEEEEQEEYEAPIIPQCVGQAQGHAYMDECNTCTCVHERLAACTLILCLPGMPGMPEESCDNRLPGDVFNKECNLCECIEGEDGLVEECSEFDCYAEEEAQIMDACEGPSCDCPPGMTGIQPFCRHMETVKELLLPEPVTAGPPILEEGELISPDEVQVDLQEVHENEPFECEYEGEEHMDDCNRCVCQRGADGELFSACTRMGCPEPLPELHGGRVRPLGNQDLVRPGNPYQQRGNQAGPAPGPGVHYQGGRVPTHNRPPMININDVPDPCENAILDGETVRDEMFCRNCTCNQGSDGSFFASCPFIRGIGDGAGCRKAPADVDAASVQEPPKPQLRQRRRPRPAVYPHSMRRFHNGQDPRPITSSHVQQLKAYHPYGASLRTKRQAA